MGFGVIHTYNICMYIYICMCAIPPRTYLLTLFGGSEGLCCMQSSCYLCNGSKNVENCPSTVLHFSIYYHDAFGECITIHYSQISLQFSLEAYCISKYCLTDYINMLQKYILENIIIR